MGIVMWEIMAGTYPWNEVEHVADIFRGVLAGQRPP
jgi:hypothetical protein